ncbi:uncharacterized protein F4812DRAFT_422540 [Daldinia caldariorum]|uniref:uncharacterized protein n=1 Tax=Daldinia caldariorum TaxID=326644 RepID=UPI0020088F2D|nr:uncharacterized protein F4812DRAFT_422540 [Daldinia caldariorum]KAI1469257.1 hypothetical protein F4812DRAFT_422540 [Daldinia caldariorum]
MPNHRGSESIFGQYRRIFTSPPKPHKTSSPTASGQPVTTTRLETLLNAWRFWKLEILSCLLVLASPLVILATLYPYDRRPLPQWPIRISVNTLLSIYSMVFKASLGFVAASCIGQLQWIWFSQERPIYDLVRYDNARQGPWGSLQLLWAQRMRQPLTALGGILLILAVGIDPFIQQLIDLDDCSIVVDDSKAMLPRTNRFNDQLEVPTFGHDIDSAISRGVTQLGSGIYPECATGNCSFPDAYGTLGYCSFCEDSSDEITIDTIHTPITNSTVWPYPNETVTIRSSLPEGIYQANNPMDLARLNVTYSINVSESDPYETFGIDGVEVAKMSIFFDDDDELSVPARPERMKVKILAGKTSFSDRHIDMSTGQIIKECENRTFANTWRCRGYGAATCAIQPCVRIYNSTVQAGHLSENLLTQTGDTAWGNHLPDNMGLGIVDTKCLTPQNKSTIINQGYVIDESQRWLPYNASFYTGGGDLSTVNISTSLLAQKCLYFMDNGFVSSFGPFVIGGYFNGALKGAGGHNGKDGLTISEFDGPDIIRSIYNYGRVDFDHIQGIFSNISESLTTYIRTNGNENYSEPAVGEVFHYATCIRVRWEWIAFPSLLVFLTMVLLIWTICSKESRTFPAWKASPLPWLMYGPDSSGLFNRDELEEIEYETDEMERISRVITITWKPLPNPHIQTD